ncbi:MAG: BtpA/SgcQ family protein [Myxococcales bacterium]|nr:BtpA/SgcQ family protein [Myxococcales bacterium]
MVHLGPLPGAPLYDGDLQGVIDRARADAEALAAGGVHAVMVENFHDAPFFKSGLPPETVAALTRAAVEVKAVIGDLPLGINALRNDGRSALAIAVASQAAFIRVNVLVGAMVTDQGIIEGCAAELLRAAKLLDARHIGVWADVAVKHAAPLGALDLSQQAKDAVHRARAAALVVSGSGTGQPTDPSRIAAVQAAVPGTPVVIGSGATPATAATLGAADAFIVGTALKGPDGLVASDRVAAMRAAVDALPPRA